MTYYAPRVRAIENTGSNKTDVENLSDEIDSLWDGSVSVDDDTNGGPGDLVVSGYDPDSPGNYSLPLPVGSFFGSRGLGSPLVWSAAEFEAEYIEIQ